MEFWYLFVVVGEYIITLKQMIPRITRICVNYKFINAI